MTRALTFAAVFIAILLVAQACAVGMTQCSIAPTDSCPN